MRMLVYFILLMSVVGFVGCSAMPIVGPAVNAYVTWIDGEAHAYYANDSRTAYNATKRALKTLNFPITKDEVNGSGNYYIVADASDRFKIKVTHIEPYVSRVSIRINFMGDKKYAELIYTHLENQMDVIDFTRTKKRLR